MAGKFGQGSFIPPGPNRHSHKHILVTFKHSSRTQGPAHRTWTVARSSSPVRYLARNTDEWMASLLPRTQWRGHLGPWTPWLHSVFVPQGAGVTLRSPKVDLNRTGQIPLAHSLIMLKTQSSQPLSFSFNRDVGPCHLKRATPGDYCQIFLFV